MNLRQSMLPYFSIVVTINMIKFASSEYEPLYFTEKENKLVFICTATYDDTTKLYIVKAPSQEILIACPSSQDKKSNMLDVQYIVENKAPVFPICNKPIESGIYKADVIRKNSDDYKAIGFAISISQPEVFDHTSSKDDIENQGQKKSPENLHYTPEKISDDEIRSNEVNQIPGTSYEILELIIFKFDDKNKRIKLASHDIAFGNFLKPEINRTGDESYQKNMDIYEYDVESLYLPNSPYAKVHLTPEEDFFFESWKSASRQNILTAPMRRELIPQWQKLEIFIRKVTQVINLVGIITGIYGTLKQSDDVESQQIIHLHDNKYPIPELFWKVVAIDFKYNDEEYREGILFVLHNVDPKVNQEVEKICPEDDVSNTGWTFLEDVEFTELMYACMWNIENMKALDEIEYFDNDVLDLNEVPLVRIVENEKVFERVNVIEEINQNSGLNLIIRYVVDWILYPYKLVSSYVPTWY